MTLDHIDDVAYLRQQLDEKQSVKDLKAQIVVFDVRVSATCPTCEGRAEGSASTLEFVPLPDGTSVSPEQKTPHGLWKRDQSEYETPTMASKVAVRVECRCGHQHDGSEETTDHGCGSYFYMEVDLT